MESERRHATVLFADVSGFTAMSEKLDPEDVVDVVNRCFALLEGAVLRWGGHVDKYEGDCIMAVFGAPTAIENTAHAAVNAAIEMRNGIEELRAERRVPAALDIHVGINTGLVLAGEVGGTQKRDYTVMGDAVNLAARLKDASPTGSIWVGPDTHRYTQEDFEYAPVPPLTLKNKEKPVLAWDVRSRQERQHRGERGIGSALVGRERDVELLRDAVAGVLEGTGGVARLVGEAGLGKTRLLGEVAALPEARQTRWLAGRCLSVGANVRFHPFVDLLRCWASIADQDPEATALAKLDAATTALLGPGASEVLPFVATLMGLQLDGAAAARVRGTSGEALEKLVAKSVRDLLYALAHAQPLVLVFEDLHWADASSLDLLADLLRLAVDARVLFILVYRSEQRGALDTLLAATARLARPSTTVALKALTLRQSDELVQNLLETHDLPLAVRAEITRKGEGNPFYVEEVVRALIDLGAIERGQGGVTLAAGVDAAALPGTISEVIMTRVDRLSAGAKALAQVAAVIGRTVPYAVLAAVADRDERTLDWELRDLRRRQLLDERHAADERELVFTHALTQESIYESISLRTRRVLHGQVAACIERLFATRLAEVYAMLAYHYSRAEDVVKAEDYLFRAGDEAARSAASAEALHFFREASRLYLQIHGDGGDPRRKALLERNIGMALLHRGQLVECVEHFETALRWLGESVPDTNAALYRRFAQDLSILLWRVSRARGRPPVGSAGEGRVESLAIRYNMNRAQTTSDTTRGFFDAVRTLRLLTGADPAAVDEACGMYAGGAALFAFSGLSFGLSRRFLPLAEALVRPDSVRDQFVLRSYRFLVDYFEGAWKAESAIAPALVEEALRYGQMWDVNTYLGLHCEQAIVQGDFAGAEADVALLARMADELGYEFARSNQYYMPAYLLLERRALDRAQEALAHYYESRHEENHTLLALSTRARIETLAGDAPGAAATLAQAEATLARLGLVSPYYLGAYLGSRFLFDVTVLEGASAGPERDRLLAAARRSGRRAVRVSRRIAREQPLILRLAGRLEWLRGRCEQGFAWWRRAREAGESLGARPELARTLMEIGERLAVPASGRRDFDGGSARDHFAAAGALFDELGLEWDRAELDRRMRAA